MTIEIKDGIQYSYDETKYSSLIDAIEKKELWLKNLADKQLEFDNSNQTEDKIKAFQDWQRNQLQGYDEKEMAGNNNVL